MIKAERLPICCSSIILELMIDWRRAINFSREKVSSSTRALGSLSGGAGLSGERSPAGERGEEVETGIEAVEDGEDAEDVEGAERRVDVGGSDGAEGAELALDVDEVVGVAEGFISSSTLEEYSE